MSREQATRRSVGLLQVTAGIFALLFIVAVALQLRPFAWDTNQVSASLLDYEKNRALLSTGGWLRASLLFPAILVAMWLRERLRDSHPSAADIAAAFMLAYGILIAASGWVAVVIGVSAEEYELGAPDAHAVEVLADSLFWIQDNLATMALLSLASGVMAFSVAMRRADTYPAWAMVAGRLMLPFALLAAAAFQLEGGATSRDSVEGPLYLLGTGGLVVTLLVWLWGAVRKPVG